MDPLALVVTALITGASRGLGETADKAVRDAYDGLKQLILRRFAGEPAIEVAVTEVEREPEAWEPALKAALERVGAAGDDEILARAQAVLEEADPNGARAGKYVVNAASIKGGIIGDFGQANYYEGVGPFRREPTRNAKRAEDRRPKR